MHYTNELDNYMDLLKQWRRGQEVARGADWFVNWADFPQLAAGPDGAVLAAWLQKCGEDTFAYEVGLGLSDATGEARVLGVLHEDRQEVEHGFVSLRSLPAGGYFAAWLDGRAKGQMGLWAAELSSEGVREREFPLDSKTCDCCQTAAVVLDDGSVVVAYRDRSDAEIRDIAVVHGRPEEPGSWSAPAAVNDDGWLMPGCPVNGPALASNGSWVAAAWFTMGSDGRPRVSCALSSDGGARFGVPVGADLGKPLGRVDALSLPSGELLVSWLELEDGGAAWMARRYAVAGDRLLPAGPPLRVAAASGERSAGFLRLGALGEPGAEGAFAAWTDPADASLRLALLRPQSGP